MEDVTIEISGGGLSLKMSTSLQKAGQIISFLGMGQTMTPGTADPSTSAPSLLSTQTKRIQPKDAILSSEAKTYPDKIAAIAAYLRDHVGQETFVPDDIKSVFRRMGDEPKNLTRDMRVASELQYIAVADHAAGSYWLTDKGNDAVATKFAVKTVKKSVSSKRAQVSSGIRDEVKALEKLGSIIGYPDYHGLEKKTDKILWLLEYADSKGINALTPTEVDYLSTELRDRIKSKSFTALNDRNIKNSYLIKGADGYQIQQKGKAYLQTLAGKETRV